LTEQSRSLSHHLRAETDPVLENWMTNKDYNPVISTVVRNTANSLESRNSSRIAFPDSDTVALHVPEARLLIHFV
jgi:hypothetical protein